MQQPSPEKTKQNQKLQKQQFQETLPPYLFVSHGEPFFSLDPNQQYYQTLEKIGKYLQQYQFKAIIIISSHYITKGKINVTSKDINDSLSDHAFEAFYNQNYNSKGSKEYANEIKQIFQNNLIDIDLDESWGLDHGAWIPASIMFPESKVPIIEMSLVDKFDKKLHKQYGLVLEKVRIAGYLIIGSGGITNNQENFFKNIGEQSDLVAEQQKYQHVQFQQSVKRIICKELGDKFFKTNLENRWKLIKDFHKLPYYSKVNTFEDHFMVLYIISAAAMELQGAQIYEEIFKDVMCLDCYIFQ